jgi:copper homeostasis protein
LSGIPLEVCVETAAAAVAAVAGGAMRIELCSSLAVGGLTPAEHEIAATLRSVRVPVHLMLRPRAGGFVRDRGELHAMLGELARIRRSGAAGVVLGLLTPERRIDVAATAALAAAARPLAVTFHRAFDQLAEPARGLDALLALGIDRVLTAGGAADAPAGATVLRALVARAGGRITVMAGGGVRAANWRALVAATGVPELHASVAFRRE